MEEQITENVEDQAEKEVSRVSKERKVVIPGEVIVSGSDYLPGEWTEKRGDEIVSVRYGLAEESNKLVRIIPLSGTYNPRRGNVVIGKVELITHNGWVIDIGAAENAFLPLTEVPRFVNKGRLDEVMKIGDMVIAKVWSTNGRGIDLSVKSRGLGKIDQGFLFNVNPHKVPRIIGKEGSMVNLVRDNTGCNITVAQNGLVLLEGEKIENEIFAQKAINFIAERSFISGLTEEVEKWFTENGGKASSQEIKGETEE